MKWLRNIIAEEVSKVEGKLTEERTNIISFISVHTKDATNSIEKETVKLFTDFEAKIRADVADLLAEKQKLIGELEEKLKSLQETVTKFSHWRADSDTVQTDKALQKVK